MRRVGCLCLLIILAACGREDADEVTRPRVYVFAAASLRDALHEIGDDFERRRQAEVVFNFAGSNVLAMQISAAPDGQVFLSADEAWVDKLDSESLLVAGSRRAFAGNELVVIAGRGSRLELEELGDLPRLDFRYLSIAEPRAVPAGRYARELLEAVSTPAGSVWSQLEERIVPAPDVRAALGLVEAEPEAVGIVYRSDARASRRTRILLAPTADLRILYVGARVTGGSRTQESDRFLDLLTTPEAQAVLSRHGFLTPPPAAEG